MSNLPPADVLDILDPEPMTKKRASWELFSFTVLKGERVEVVNKSLTPRPKIIATPSTSVALFHSVAPVPLSHTEKGLASTWWLSRWRGLISTHGMRGSQ